MGKDVKMEKDIKILIVGDIHGREFWKEPVKTVLENSDAKIVFLGDYLDPYPWEFDSDFELGHDASTGYLQTTIDNFKQIIELKKRYSDRIALLLGNHDCTYAISTDICNSRTDYLHFDEIKKLFDDNRNCFQIAKEENINGKHLIFSHAGMLKEYFKEQFPDINFEKVNPVEFLNNAWLVKDYSVLYALGVYDYYRGYGGVKYASPVWSDIRMWATIKPEETFGFNVVGHTQLKEEPIMFEAIACLDCRKCFYANSNGDIVDYETDKVIEKTIKPTD